MVKPKRPFLSLVAYFTGEEIKTLTPLSGEPAASVTMALKGRQLTESDCAKEATADSRKMQSTKVILFIRI